MHNFVCLFPFAPSLLSLCILEIISAEVQEVRIRELSLELSQKFFPSGRHPDLRQNLEAPVMTDKDCQKTQQGSSHRNSLCVKFVKTFSRIFGVIFLSMFRFQLLVCV